MEEKFVVFFSEIDFKAHMVNPFCIDFVVHLYLFRLWQRNLSLEIKLFVGRETWK
jgi:hypothetical protein